MVTELISHLVKKLVDQPDTVVISEVRDQDKIVVQVHVAPQDLARVIGAEGRTFRALRSVVSLVNPAHQTDLVVDIIQQQS